MSVRVRTYRNDRSISVQLHLKLFRVFYRFALSFEYTPIGSAL